MVRGEVNGSETTVRKFYALGSMAVAVRAVVGTQDTLKWVLGDHLGSTSVTANEDGSWNSELRYTAFGEVRASQGLTPTEYRFTNQLEQITIGLYYYGARWYDPYLNHFVQADSIVPGVGNAEAFDRYAYSNNNPINYNDPSGHCAVSAFPSPLGIFGFYGSCAQDIVDTYNSYQAGERRLGILYLEATGAKDLIVSTAEVVNQLNSDKDTVFSDAPLDERIMPSVRLGSWAVSTSANIVGGVQAARGALALSRSGAGGSEYAVQGTQRKQVFGPGDELYRVYGGKTRQNGSFAFTQNPGNGITAIRKGALPPENATTLMTRVTFNASIEAEVSKVAPYFRQPGGLTQVKLPQVRPQVVYSPGKLFPLGFMPMVPVRPLFNSLRRWD
jgi:RHS repeat-associated protein